MTNTEKDESLSLQVEAREEIRKAFEDKAATLPSGNTYNFTTLTHKKRLKVFTRFQLLEEQGLMFFDSTDFEIVQGIIDDTVLFDGMQLSKLKDHWEENAHDFFLFYRTAMGVISYPFLHGNG